MLTFFTDESAVSGGGAEEYNVSIYGGLILKEETIRSLSQFLYKLKDRYVLPQEVEIKWRFASYWENLKAVGYIDRSFTKKLNPDAYESFKADHLLIKNEIIEEVARSNAEIVVAVRPNQLLRASDEQIVEYSIAAVARKFEKVLKREEEYGIILADELPKRLNQNAVIDHQYILKLCCRGSGTVAFNRLVSIVPTVNSKVSPIHQVNDMVLGAVQYYILEFIRTSNDPTWNMDTAREVLRKLVSNFHLDSEGTYIINNGILLYPPKVNRRNTRAGTFLNNLEQALRNDFAII